MAAPTLPVDDVTAHLAQLPGWVLVDSALHARHDAPDVPTATRLVTEVFEVAEEMNHHPDADIRWRRVRWRLTTHDAGGVTHLDLELARSISRLAAEAGATTMALPAAGVVTIGVDTADQDRLVPVWEAALGLPASRDETGVARIVDPTGALPEVWFQRADPPATGRNRLHVDVYVDERQAPERRQAVEAAGGRLVTDRFAPSWWVYADPDGNELCVCTHRGEDEDPAAEG